MDSSIFYLGSFYFVIGIIFLLVPLIYLELGRPNDLIKAFLNLSIGFILIIKNKTISETSFVIFILITVLVCIYLAELFLFRWNQLTDKEKNKLTTFLEFKNNLSKILEAINLGVMNLIKPYDFLNFDSNNEKIKSKKWERNDKNYKNYKNDKNDKNDNIKI